MKKFASVLILFFALCFLSVSAQHWDSYVYSSGITYNGNQVPDISVKKVNGHYFFSVPRLKGKWFPVKARVQVVDTLADLIVNRTYAHEHANMYIVRCDSTPVKDLQWQFVDSDPDFTIQYKYHGDYDFSIFFWPEFCKIPSSLSITTKHKTFWVPQ